MRISRHYKQFWAGIGCLFASLFPSVTLSEFVQDLYEVQVVVEDQSEAKRNPAFAQALRDLLIRLTGNAAAANNAAIKQTIKKPAKFVQQYRYVEIPRMNQDAQQGILVQFDEASVNQILQNQGLPLWGRERPLTLVILVTEQAGKRWIIGGSEQSELAWQLKQAATSRGMPLVLPLLDLSDQAAGLDAEKIWSGNFDALEGLREKYDAEGVLVANAKMPILPEVPTDAKQGALDAEKPADEKPIDGKPAASANPVDQAMDKLEIHWTYLQGEAPSKWSSTKADAISQGVSILAERLAPQYAVASRAATSQTLNMRVEAIPDMAAYFRVRSFLEQLTMVKSLSLVAIEQSSLVLKLQINGDAQALSKSISLGRLLQPATEPAETTPEGAQASNTEAVLSYRYIQ